MSDINNISKSLETIKEKEPEFYQAIVEVLEYLASTYNEKYANADLDNKGIIYSKKLGKGFNIGNAAKYLGRYLTEGFTKSEMTLDLKKAIHYCLFELTRRNKIQ